MTDPTNSRRRGLVLALLILLAAAMVYWGVSKTARDARSVPRPGGDQAEGADRFRPWDSLSLATAQSQNRLIVLLVTDTRNQASRELLARAANDDAWLGTGVMAITADRRLAPDVALRYANEAAPFALLLLPTGEALATLDGAPSEWPKTIAEVDRYWREHPEQIQKRVVDFWEEEVGRATSARPPRTPDVSDLKVIDSTVQTFVAQVLAEPQGNAGLWRIDISTYLALRAPSSARSESLLTALHTARARQWSELFDTVRAVVPPFGVAQLATEDLEAHPGDDQARARATAAANWLTAFTEPLTAAEVASLASLRRALDSTGAGAPETGYPGMWLGRKPDLPRSLPHVARSDAALDGYLADALAWLEYLAGGTSPEDLAGAERLADSLWASLWAPDAHALRDKPLRPSYVREIARYPRAQLGRAAMLFYELHDRTGQDRFRAWADSCLAGFAPYAADAGSAAAYYGAALTRSLKGR